jgi:DNA-binding transcriptional LysR family regulator
MELEQLRAFLAVVEHGGYRRAAAHLPYSQTALTRQVARLEQVLGVQLLHRGAGGATPTRAGARFAMHAQRVLDEAAAAVRSARGEGEGGELVLGVQPGGAAELTRPLYRELRRLLPAVRWRVRLLRLLDWSPDLPEGVDLAILREPIDEQRLRTTTLLAEPLLVCVPQRFAEADAVALQVEQVLRLPLIGMAPGVPAPLRRYWTLADLAGGREVHHVGRVGDPGAVVRAVHAGHGVALATRSLSRAFDDHRLPLVPVRGLPPTRVVLASQAQDRRPLLDRVHAEAARVVQRLSGLVLPVA